MRTLALSKTRDYFTVDGSGAFLLADTIWFAFSHMTLEEWDYYLNYRRTQGFNALQLGILPITNDASESKLNLSPFALTAEGHYDFEQINDAYFDRAERMVAMAAERGFRCSMIVLQHNYVADDWGAAMSPWTVMPYECMERYVAYVTNRFGPYQPVFIVSGDSTLSTETSRSYYLRALAIIKAINPSIMTTMHTRHDVEMLPESFLQNDLLDFYIYQSGHHLHGQKWAYEYAQRYYHSPVKRPIISVEVCYEGHGHADTYGRYTAFDVRKAMWQSILAGAKAGITYGAHGLWGLHIKGAAFNNERFSSVPYDWQTALRFGGAWDASFIKWIFDRYALYDIEPHLGILNESEKKRDEIRMAVSATADKVVLYAPYSTEILVDLDLTAYDFTMVNLTERLFGVPVVKRVGQHSVIDMHDFNSDVLLIGVRRDSRTG